MVYKAYFRNPHDLKQEQFSFEYQVYDALTDLKAESRSLFASAMEALKTSYSPYSNYPVAAAVLLDNGEVITGSNQENAAYPSGLCAERIAVFAAKSRYPEAKIEQLAIVVASDDGGVVAPCGACRQVLIEYEILQNKPFLLILGSPKGKTYTFSGLRGLLPFSFGPEKLKK